ncbi:MAG: ABC transporter substrate-binding protein [Candidatus Bipolaricaulia bacterium]
MTALGGTVATASLFGPRLRGQSLPTLKVSLPPMIDSVPIAFGNDQGIFPDHGLQVEPVAFSKVSARNTNLLTGSVDGAVIDISSVVQLLANDGTLQITSTAYESVDQRRYAMIVQPWANVNDLSELISLLGDGAQRESTIGLSRRTDIEFATDRLIASTDTAVNESAYYANWNDVLQLATLIASGSWLSGSLPEPAGSYLEIITQSNGSPVKTVSSFDELDLVPSVFVFQNKLIDGNPDVIEAFYSGYQAATSELANTERDQAVNIALDAALQFFFPSLNKNELPPGSDEFFANYLIPTFPAPRTLAAEEYQRVADWNVDKAYVSKPPSFDLAVTESFDGVLSQAS